VGPTVIRRGLGWRGNSGITYGPIASIAWGGSGDALITAGHYESQEEFVSWRVSEEGRRLDPLQSYGPCPGRTNLQNDILTTNSLMLVPDPPRLPTATPSPSATPTATATHTPTTTVTATPTRQPAPIFLPVAVRESCQEVWVHADVALVLDTSTSMNRPTRSGRSKLAATQDAAKAFVDLMDFTPDATGQHDQVAVVGFNDDAWIQTDLTNDSVDIRRAIDDLPRRQHEGTRLDLAFARGADALAPERRRPDNTPVLVLLTDGLPNRVPTPVSGGSQEDTVLAAAGRAKDGGIHVYTIALGAPEDTNPALLEACATDPSMYHYAPDAEDLGAIYTAIAYAVGCPKERYWGGR
jgi:Mg-chelatase subunit ChlD